MLFVLDFCVNWGKKSQFLGFELIGIRNYFSQVSGCGKRGIGIIRFQIDGNVELKFPDFRIIWHEETGYPEFRGRSDRKWYSLPLFPRLP